MHRSRIPKASGGLHRENPNGGRSEAAVPCLSEDHAREEQSHDGQPCRGNSHSSYRRLQLLQQDFQSQELSEESPQKMRTCQLITLLFNNSWKWTLWRPLLSDSMHLGFHINTWLDFSLNLMTRENHFKLNSVYVNAYNCEILSRSWWCPNCHQSIRGDILFKGGDMRTAEAEQ